jgi:Family of unknown function (DUF6807)
LARRAVTISLLLLRRLLHFALSEVTAMRLLMIGITLACCAAPARLAAQDKTVTITIAADKADYRNTPVCIPLQLPASAGKFTYARLTGSGQNLQGQLTAPGIVTEQSAAARNGQVRRDLHLVVPSLNKGESLTLAAQLFEFDNAPDPNGFVWSPFKDRPPELEFVKLGGAERRPVLRYMNAAFDDSTMDRRDRTYKVFHHLFDPDGKRLVTNGGQTDLKEGEERKLLYPHHRGIMFGFNKCSYGEGLKKKADTWHCPPKGDLYAYVAHEKILGQEAGAVLGRHRVQIGWHGRDKERFVQEERELTAYNLPGGTLIEFASRLKTTGGKVRLDGDPQHAGFQFRASNDVADKSKKETYYLHPDGKGDYGKERNWDPKTKQGPVDLPWYAMSFVLDGQRYTVCYLNHPRNPKESRFSERDYGRFGCYFEYNLTQEHPLVVSYRLWLQKGEMTQAECQGIYDTFASGPKTAVK